MEALSALLALREGDASVKSGFPLEGKWRGVVDVMFWLARTSSWTKIEGNARLPTKYWYMINDRFTPNSRRTWGWLTTKKWPNSRLIGSWSARSYVPSYVTHQKVICYSWILAITRAFSPLKSISSTTAFNRQKRSWNLSISLASDPTRSSILPRSQVGRHSLDGLVCHSARL